MTKEDLIGTTWQFNDTLIVGNLFVNKKYIFDVKIESDEQVSNSLFVEKGNEPQTIIDITAEFAQIYDSTWNERYKVFTILETKNLADEAVFMQFLTDNATRVKSVSLQNLKVFKEECDKIYGGGTSITTATTEEIQALFVSAKLIEFYMEPFIVGNPTRTLQAEDGMTWGEWINSKYNVDKDFSEEIAQSHIQTNGGYLTNVRDDVRVQANSNAGVYIKITDKIIANETYSNVPIDDSGNAGGDTGGR